MRNTKLILVVCVLAAAVGVAFLFASSATLVAPAKVAVDKAGNIYISDLHNSTIDKLTPDGKLTIVAGESGKPGLATGRGSQARFIDPSGIAVGPDGSLVVADEVNNVVYKVGSDGVVTILAGTQWSPTFADAKMRSETGKASAREFGDGTGVQVRFNSPEGIAVDSLGNAYVADANNNVIRKITPAGQVTTVAGSPGERGSADGRAAVARFYAPQGVAADELGNLYVADTGNNAIRKITPDGSVSTLAGKAGEVGHADGKGGAARFYALRDIAIDRAGNLYVVDSGNFNIRKITPAGDVSTVAGQGSRLSELGLGLPTGIAVDQIGNIYIADISLVRITRISPSGAIVVMAGSQRKVE